MAIKKLYEFIVDKEVQVVEKEVSTNEAGEKVTIEKNVTKSVPISYFIQKPTRDLIDDADLYYGVELSKGIKAGLMTRTQINKRYVDDGGILPDTTKKAESDTYNELFNAQLELETLKAIKEEDRPEDFTTKVSLLSDKVNYIKKSLTDLEIQKESLFDSSAENRARNKTITWWILNLAYKTEDGKDLPFFSGNTVEKQLKSYDEILEGEDTHLIKVANDFIYLISYWYVGQAKTKEDFAKILEDRRAETA